MASIKPRSTLTDTNKKTPFLRRTTNDPDFLLQWSFRLNVTPTGVPTAPIHELSRAPRDPPESLDVRPHSSRMLVHRRITFSTHHHHPGRHDISAPGHARAPPPELGRISLTVGELPLRLVDRPNARGGAALFVLTYNSRAMYLLTLFVTSSSNSILWSGSGKGHSLRTP